MVDILLTIPAFIILLGTLIFFHELGHFTVAKLFKVKVEEFAFGFGPKWIRLFKRGDTEYTIHPIPLGGFVKLAGMDPHEPEVPRGFTSKPWWARFLVFSAGPTMSFALGYLIFSSLGMTTGLPTAINEIGQVVPESRAEQAGLMAGDRIVEIDGERIETGQEMVAVIHRSAEKELTIVVERNSDTVTVHATPAAGTLGGQEVGLLGFAPARDVQRVGLIESVKFGTESTTEFIKLIVTTIFSREVKDNVGGPIAIVAATKHSVSGGISHFVFLMGILSLSLGIINLLPIPVVDGGQMVLLVAEGVKGRRLSPKTLEIAQKIGLMILATILILVLYLDVTRLVTGKLIP